MSRRANIWAGKPRRYRHRPAWPSWWGLYAAAVASFLTPGSGFSPLPPSFPLLRLPFSSGTAAMGKGDPNKPRGKMSSYAYFVQTCREEHKKKHPDSSVNFAEFSKKCSERWRVRGSLSQAQPASPCLARAAPPPFFLLFSPPVGLARVAVTRARPVFFFKGGNLSCKPAFPEIVHFSSPPTFIVCSAWPTVSELYRLEADLKRLPKTAFSCLLSKPLK